MENLVVRISLPKGLAVEGGADLSEDVTFEIVGTVNPWYCSIDQVRAHGGTFVRRLQDITIAAAIYQYGRDVDMQTYRRPTEPLPGTDMNSYAVQKYQRFLYARQRYTMAAAAKELIINVQDVEMSRGSKTLGNFSVSAVSQDKGEDVPKKLVELDKEIKSWLVVIQSGADIGKGGYVQPAMAAKGVYGDADAPSGRTWMTTGLGANKKSLPGYGSQGKPVKFGSPSIVQFRIGRYMGGYLTMIPKRLFSGSF